MAKLNAVETVFRRLLDWAGQISDECGVEIHWEAETLYWMEMLWRQPDGEAKVERRLSAVRDDVKSRCVAAPTAGRVYLNIKADGRTEVCSIVPVAA